MRNAVHGIYSFGFVLRGRGNLGPLSQEDCSCLKVWQPAKPRMEQKMSYYLEHDLLQLGVRQRKDEQPTAGVKYYGSVSKAAQASQTSNQKAISWDWLSNSSDKVPMKDVVRSICFHAEITTKASYELVAAANVIVEVVHGQRELMTEQCALLKVIAENQQELANLIFFRV